MDERAGVKGAGKPASAGRVTLRDIAEAVGVSVSTASRALSGAPGISRDVRQRVQTVADELEYGGTAARADSIVVIGDLHVAESGAGEFIQAIQRGIEWQAGELGLNLTMQYVVLGSTMSLDLAAGADGYLLLSLQADEVIARVGETGVPTVIVNGRESVMRLDAVAPANRTGGYLGTRHLIDLGHERILVLGHSARPTIRDRISGRSKALRDAGLPEDPRLVVDLEAMRTNLAYREVKARLPRKGRPDFTAIQCCNDSCAFGAIAALAEAGLQVPADVSVVGFDDIPTAALNSVPLTTIRVDAFDIGARSVRRLVDRIRGRDRLATYTETEVSLIPRQSTGAAPA